MLDKRETPNLPKLRSKRIQLRPIERLDEERLWMILSDYPAVHSASTNKNPSFYQSKKILKQILNRDEDHHLHFGICLGETHDLIGLVSLQNWSKSQSVATLGYILDRLYWGRGLATEAVELLINYGFRELGLTRIEGRCSEDNIASERVMVKNGFTHDRIHPARYGSDRSTVKINIYSLCYINEI
ncbi:GNAT family N-acetyltransferase [Paenibacillus crassostreae]|uniref:N-acetyltransferase domain-containing protein n=1 Tax=Paenibacillus crassostreae TaxID=1763538 RepID=A0A167GPX7_9BACL|nr:GNAT family N-acetyltransferase [Paenibacillus crassostreae]AOZ91982.1 hypothetical protein LPB68_06945 [Paenibacillus crassostreae]OAB77789.1 hypothetical protein PNBC_00025 [Paenibacillus crassostreae]